jgi:hypothetical protein
MNEASTGGTDTHTWKCKKHKQFEFEILMGKRLFGNLAVKGRKLLQPVSYRHVVR